MFPVAWIDIVKGITIAFTNDESNINRVNETAYSGTFFSQICNTKSVFIHNGKTKKTKGKMMP